MKRLAWVLILGLLGLTACTTFHGVKPIYPGVGNPNYDPPTVDSLQPILRWKPSPVPDVSYDLIIYECVKAGSFGSWEGIQRTMGKVAYYREGIPEPEHKVEESLKADREYYWSVRVRQGEKVSAWSVYDYDLFLVTAYMFAKNQFFRFKTPEK